MQIRFMVPMHGVKAVGAFHEPAVSERGSVTRRTWGCSDALRLTEPRSHRVAQVHGPNACAKRKGALHEPTHARPLRGGEQASVRVLSVPLLGGVRGGFMVPMHAKNALSMNHGWFGVPPLGGWNGLDWLKPGLQAVRGFMVPMRAEKTEGGSPCAAWSLPTSRTAEHRGRLVCMGS